MRRGFADIVICCPTTQMQLQIGNEMERKENSRCSLCLLNKYAVQIRFGWGWKSKSWKIVFAYCNEMCNLKGGIVLFYSPRIEAFPYEVAL